MAKNIIMKIENIPLSPSGCGQTDDLWEEEVSCQLLTRKAKAGRGRGAGCPSASYTSVACWQPGDQSQSESSSCIAETNRTHSYSHTKSKRYSCQQWKTTRSWCLGPAPSLPILTSSPQSSSHPCFCKSVWITALETRPRSHLLTGAVLDWPPHHTLIINFPHILPTQRG